MKKRKKIVLLLFALLFLLIVASFYLPFPKSRLSPAPVISLRIVDRNGILLRDVLSDEGGRCRWVKLEDVSPSLIQATVASEDKNFYSHSGVNLLSVVRAFCQNIRHKRIVSGASTISQQLLRNIYHGRRNFLSKVHEVWMSLRLEHSLSKEEILVQYLNRICYGNQAYGVEAASSLYFDKPPSHLSIAESAFLAGLPRLPSLLNPYRNLPGILKRQKEILRKMHDLGFINKEEMARAVSERLNLISEKNKFRAPHFCDFIISQIPGPERRAWSIVRTTLDCPLQEKVEILLRNHLKSLAKRGITNGAVVILDNTTGDILSMAGSKDFFDAEHDGQVNGTLAPRQPGSALKPFTYAIALEKGMTAATFLEDSLIQFPTLEGNFMPQNYDRKYHGPIRLRNALACSYNIPAVSVLQTIGPELLYERLKALGFDSLQKSASFYGLGLTLGNGEVSLLELVRAYAALARGGVFFRERCLLELVGSDKKTVVFPEKATTRAVFSPQVSYLITHILSDKDARIPSFGYNSPLSLLFPAAAKTGTSKDFRDNWTVGYTSACTVGVWVGNFDGEPMHNVSGITGCGPLFRDIMLLLNKERKGDDFSKPSDLLAVAICPHSGKLPGKFCPGAIEEFFIQGTEPREVCGLPHRHNPERNFESRQKQIAVKAQMKIAFPQEGDIFKIDPVLRKEYQTLKLRARVPEEWGGQAVEWWINGEKIGVSSRPYSFSWNLKPGSYMIKVRAAGEKKALESQPVKIVVLT